MAQLYQGIDSSSDTKTSKTSTPVVILYKTISGTLISYKTSSKGGTTYYKTIMGTLVSYKTNNAGVRLSHRTIRKDLNRKLSLTTPQSTTKLSDLNYSALKIEKPVVIPADTLGNSFYCNSKIVRPVIISADTLGVPSYSGAKIVRPTVLPTDTFQSIETFVFLDLETTGLIRGGVLPQITELAMVAAARDSIKCGKNNKLSLPRIIHKIIIPVQPTERIDPIASELTDLTNDSLKNVSYFDEATSKMIMLFIKRLPGKICFVAHNGYAFDYPILMNQFELLNKVFPERIVCVDSLLAFRALFRDAAEYIPMEVEKKETSESLNVATLTRPKNFKLITLHAHLVGCEAPNQHSAEGDCISMLRCVLQMGARFIDYADSNSIYLNSSTFVNNINQY